MTPKPQQRPLPPEPVTPKEARISNGKKGIMDHRHMRLHYILSEKQKQTNNTLRGRSPIKVFSHIHEHWYTVAHAIWKIKCKISCLPSHFLLMSSISMKTDKMKFHAIIQYLKRKGFYPKAIYEGIVQTFVSE